MQYRKLGRTGWNISAVGFGCMGLSHAFGTAMEKSEAVNRIKKAYELGYTFFDTAECYKGTYSDGTVANNEEVVGEGLKGIRDNVILATKCGVTHTFHGLTMDSSPETIRKSIEGSLKRLQTDYVDLYYQHRIDPKVEPEVVAETMGKLIREGKIRAWGISAVDEAYLRRANAVTPVTAVENMFNMIDRSVENLFPVIEELGVTLVPYTPLAKGFLTGTYTERPTFEHPEDNRGGRYQFTEEGFRYYQDALTLIRTTAEEKGATMAQIALAWMICKKPWITPIPGTRNVDRMKENADASDIRLTAAEVKKLDETLDRMNLVDTTARRVR